MRAINKGRPRFNIGEQADTDDIFMMRVEHPMYPKQVFKIAGKASNITEELDRIMEKADHWESVPQDRIG